MDYEAKLASMRGNWAGAAGGLRCKNSSRRACITSPWSAPTGRHPSISGRACSACPSCSSSPISTRRRESHLYFDPGDGRLITIFTDETRKPDATPTAREQGSVHHIAFSVSRVTFLQAVARLDERGISHSGVKDRGFMDSIYFRDPLGLLIELASYRFEPPAGATHVDVLMEAHKLRVARGDPNIAEVHLADAIEKLTRGGSESLSEDRSPKDPYRPRAGADGARRRRRPQPAG